MAGPGCCMCKLCMHAVRHGMPAWHFAKAAHHLHCKLLMSLPKLACMCLPPALYQRRHPQLGLSQAARPCLGGVGSTAVGQPTNCTDTGQGAWRCSSSLGVYCIVPLPKPHHDVLRPETLPT